MLKRALSIVASTLRLTSAHINSTMRTNAQPIIIDTDIFSDVDDLGAIAIANVLHNCGLADLRGIAVNTPSRYGALASSAICTYYNNGHIPVSILRPLTNELFVDDWPKEPGDVGFGEFARKVSENFPRTLDSADDAPTPVDMYRRVLATAADNSMHLISIGFLTNLAALLRSEPDEISPLTGLQLVEAKVSGLAVMGGRYPSGRDYNFRSDPKSAIYTIENWPKHIAITYSGSEFGREILSGQTLPKDAPKGSPVLAAYQWYVGPETTQKSWDPLTVLYGVLGLDGFATLGLECPFQFANENGYNSFINEAALNEWVEDEGVTNQHWLKLADGDEQQRKEYVEGLLNHLLTRGPEARTCFDQYNAGLYVR